MVAVFVCIVSGTNGAAAHVFYSHWFRSKTAQTLTAPGNATAHRGNVTIFPPERVVESTDGEC